METFITIIEIMFLFGSIGFAIYLFNAWVDSQVR